MNRPLWSRRRDDDVAEGQEGDHRGNHEHGDRALPAEQAVAQHVVDVRGRGGRHARERRRGHAHAEQPDRELVELRGDAERGQCPGRQVAGNRGIDERAHLDGAAAEEHGNGRRDDAPDVLVKLVARPTPARRHDAPHAWHLHPELQGPADHSGPGQVNGDGRQLVGAVEDERHNHREVPRDGRHVGQEKLVVRVENGQTPGREHEQTHARKQDADQLDGEPEFFTSVEHAREAHDRRREGDAEQDDDRRDHDEQAQNGAGHAVGVLLLRLLQQPGVDGYQRRRQHAFAQQVLQKIRNAQRGVEGIGHVGLNRRRRARRGPAGRSRKRD